MSHVVKYSETIEPNTIKCNNILIGNNTTDYGPTSVTNFYAGIDPSSFSGYTVYLTGGSTNINARHATTDNELMLIAQEYGGININSVEEAIAYFVTGSTNTTIINTEYPSIVTSGLTFNFDAGFLPSYPKNGNKLYNLINSSYTGTFTTGITYNSEYNGNLFFDGNNYINFTSFPSHITISFWFKTVSSSEQIIIGGIYLSNVYSIQLRNNKICACWGSGQSMQSVKNNFNNGQWYFVTFVNTGNEYPNKFDLYVNSNYEVLETDGPYRVSNARLIGCRLYSGIYGYYFTGNIGNVMFYDRILSEIEITQNYNVTKSRFGL